MMIERSQLVFVPTDIKVNIMLHIYLGNFIRKYYEWLRF
jgi:hypothetical protein